MTSTPLRVMVATIEGELARLTAATAEGELPGAMVTELRVSWARLVQMLPLGEPAYQPCPICRHILRRTACFCGYCFATVTPAADNDG